MFCCLAASLHSVSPCSHPENSYLDWRAMRLGHRRGWKPLSNIELRKKQKCQNLRDTSGKFQERYQENHKLEGLQGEELEADKPGLEFSPALYFLGVWKICLNIQPEFSLFVIVGH